jgi:hypothetical protein
MMYEFPHPDRVAVGALGPAGERSFVIQIRQGERLVAIGIQRQAVLSIARRIDSLLREATALGWLGETPQVDPELGPLDAPVDVLFTVGAIGWALDTRRGAIQLEFYPDDRDVRDMAALVQVWLYPGMARQFAARARVIVATADPSCPFCSQPVHATGHICPRSNGYRAPLF